jgi:hypothetical protein
MRTDEEQTKDIASSDITKQPPQWQLILDSKIEVA